MPGDETFLVGLIVALAALLSVRKLWRTITRAEVRCRCDGTCPLVDSDRCRQHMQNNRRGDDPMTKA